MDDSPGGGEPVTPSLEQREGATALRNGAKLATSLLLTWGVALVITFMLPKYLGPLAWGYYKYGFEYAAALAVFVHFGVDTYISREIPVRPKHASDFFVGVLLARTLMIAPLFAYGYLHLAHKLHEERVAAALFGLTHVFIVMNLTFQQILQAASTVGRLAVANVIAKILWGAGTFVALALHAPFWVFPLPMLAAESLKAFFLYRATRAAIGLELRFDFVETKRVLRVSFPFFIAIAAVYLGSSVDVLVLRELVPDGSREVGWYSAAREIARLSAMMMPVLTGVLVPMMSRAKHADDATRSSAATGATPTTDGDAFFRILRRGMEGVSVISIPLTLMLALGSEWAIGLVLKDKFLPAAFSLMWLAPTFVLAYANCLLWLALMIMKRSWTITVVSIVGLALLPVFILLIAPRVDASVPGHMGMAVAMALSLRELVIVIVFFTVVGRRALDRRAVLAIGKSLVICGVVVGAHHGLGAITGGFWRLVADGALYLALALATRVLRPSDVKGVLHLIKNRRAIQAEADAAEKRSTHAAA